MTDVDNESEVDRARFEIDVNDEVTLSRGDLLAHAEHGAMVVDQITISAIGKRARLRCEERTDGMSIELSEEEIRETWGDTLGSDPFEVQPETPRYSNEFASKDDEVEISIEVTGPEDRAEPVMAHLHDQTISVLRAFENGIPPEETEGTYEFDWEAILADAGGDADGGE